MAKGLVKSKGGVEAVDFSIGCDPELMLVDKDGNLKSAIPFIKGTKEQPIQFEDGSGMVSHDNVMLEYGTKPAKSEDEFVEVNRQVLQHIVKMLPAGIIMVVRASADFPAAELQDEAAKKFGCDPDFDPYEFEMNSITPGAETLPFRTCGGHIHIGHKKVADDIDVICDVAKGFDAFLTIPMSLVSKDPTAAKRRQLYGKAGAHRPKPYGVEYRAIDNYWVGSPQLTRLVYKLSRDGLSAILAGHLRGIDEKHLKKVVNTGDLKAGATLLNDFVRPLLAADTRTLLDQAMNLPRPDIYESWGLKK
jgi:hypothetical protein